ncbi:bifunctional proline dehydrogenase/L-glutamate gamma-semialdehyde dehydrogenase [Cellulomonas marina]|uniref:L-glutamate gamma-semialdehyde dehydrogenase n=1 Tax=Cellulomonas marina TaxID=988821 RepID=A0A1I0WPC1_9CELL|nr:bifunctional proline dehydrogenase/L-glutamate gamma-semialdehyde dehydrogenase [Cellulomonas marina]GIG27783.1 1-pyrroline-5-carboxylate dehydrogenase [Cellulomonas marina]SFA90461.1 RHH-type transcriptional regulator, proline utilization regulon repressor / proline dehydrogenase / delta 1-pyrroline-5-carboxylate dehydrogenase [Cellulomonas marina]
MTDLLPLPAPPSPVPVPGTGLDRDEHLALVPEVEALVRRWLDEASAHPADPAAARLAGLLTDPDGLAFAVGFVDDVVRPEDLGVAARALARLAPGVPRFLPAHLRAAVRLGGVLAPVLPWAVVPVARRVLRSMVGHLVVDATDARLGRAIAALRSEPGTRLNVNLLGEAVLGRREADRRLAGLRRLVERPDVTYVSVKVSAAVEPHAPWAFEAAVEDVVERLAPLYATAAATDPPTFVNLDMEEYRDLDVTLAVFERLLDRPELLHLEAGVVLQAYLPDAVAALARVQAWAAARRARAGAPVKVRVVKGANLPMERVEAELHGWPLATWGSKVATDTQYKRVLDLALRPAHTDAVRVGVAGHNLFDVAHAWLLAGRRGVRDAMDVEMLLGMAPGQAAAVRREVGELLLYTPVVAPAELDVAIAYLVRRLEEGASSDNFMSAVFSLHDDEDLLRRERDRYVASVEALTPEVPAPHRTADRYAAVGRPGTGGRRARWVSTPATDPAVAENRAWVDGILARAAGSVLGVAEVAAARVDDEDALDALLRATAAAGRAWGARPAGERAAVLHRAGHALEERRAALLEVMAAEAGKTVDQGDPEVSEAVDFAHHTAELALDLEAVDGARPVPVPLTLVVPPWNFPVAIPAGGVLAALAAGSAVVLKPAPPARRCAAVVAEALWAAGVPESVLRLVVVDDEPLGPALVAHPAVDRVLLTGSYETAELFRRLRPDLPLLAETSGKNAVVVAPSADLDAAARDVVASAFGHAGQKCSAASLVVLVGSVGRSRRFRDQLLDAVASLPVGEVWDPRTRMGPLVEPAGGKLLAGLTDLGDGERWALRPERLDAEGRLWSPGVRVGVRRGSAFHRTEYFGPVLGVMTVATLEEALEVVDDVDLGLTAGLQTRDADDLARWLDGVEAGNLYVNRGTTGAIVRRQPFGGWKRSAVGPGAKVGGPDHLLPLVGWADAPATRGRPVTDPAVRALVDAADAVPGLLDEAARARLARATGSDADALATHLAATDLAGLACERDVLRHLPVVAGRGGPVEVRAVAGAPVVDVVRVVAAALAVGADVAVSLADDPGLDLATALAAAGDVRVEDDAAWAARLARRRVAPTGAAWPLRVRLVGHWEAGTGADGDRSREGGTAAAAAALRDATAGRPDVAVWSDPVTESGRVETRPFVLEQAVSLTAHRFGTPDALARDARLDVGTPPVAGSSAQAARAAGRPHR